MNAVEHPGDERRLSRRMRHRRRELLWRARLKAGPGYVRWAADTRPDPDCPELAVGAVAMGAKYADWCLTMISTVRDRGAYRGPIYVITDLPALFSGLDNTVVISVPPTRHRLIAKGCKQVLMRYVTEPVFLYLDSDLVVTSSLSQWYRGMKPALQQVPVLCYEDVKPVAGAYHGGVVLLDMCRATPIIDRWQKAVRSGRWGSDQACLYSVAGPDGPGHLPNKGFMFLQGLLTDKHTPECIVHVTNGVIRANQREEIESYLVEQLGVSRLPQAFD